MAEGMEGCRSTNCQGCILFFEEDQKLTYTIISSSCLHHTIKSFANIIDHPDVCAGLQRHLALPSGEHSECLGCDPRADGAMARPPGTAHHHARLLPLRLHPGAGLSVLVRSHPGPPLGPIQ